ncbi:hypothetical protein V8C42DRAFT_186108 [Trichoderma barbatum]
MYGVRSTSQHDTRLDVRCPHAWPGNRPELSVAAWCASFVVVVQMQSTERDLLPAAGAVGMSMFLADLHVHASVQHCRGPTTVSSYCNGGATPTWPVEMSESPTAPAATAGRPGFRTQDQDLGLAASGDGIHSMARAGISSWGATRHLHHPTRFSLVRACTTTSLTAYHASHCSRLSTIPVLRRGYQAAGPPGASSFQHRPMLCVPARRSLDGPRSLAISPLRHVRVKC